jgi:hypothetical protein
MITTGEAIETLREAGYFVDNLWGWEDINVLCEEESLPEMSREDCIAFFAYVSNNFNAEIGLNWESLRENLKEYINNK